MKRIHRYLLQAAAIFCTFSMLLYLPASATQGQIDSVINTIKGLENEQKESLRELEGLQENKAILDGRLSELNTQLSTLAYELTGLEEQLVQKEKDIRLTQEQLNQAEEEEEAQYKDMKKRIRFFYEKGDTTLLEALLASENFTDFINRAEYVQNIHEYDRRMLTQYQQVTEEIAVKEEKLKGEQQELSALVENQQEKLSQVQVLVAQVESDIDAASLEISNTEKQLAKYEERLEEQRAYEKQLEDEKAAADAKRQKELEQEKENQNQQNQPSGSPNSDGQDTGSYPETPPASGGSDSDLALLAAIIECEVGNQSYECKLAVGSVVMNRVNSPLFSNTILGVLYEKGQFTPVASGRFADTLSRGADASCVQAASDVLAGTITLDKLFFKRNRGDRDGIVIGDVLFY